MLTIALSDVEILAVRLFTVCFNVFARLHKVYGSRGEEFKEIKSMYEVRPKSRKIVFLVGTF